MLIDVLVAARRKKHDTAKRSVEEVKRYKATKVD